MSDARNLGDNLEPAGQVQPVEPPQGELSPSAQMVTTMPDRLEKAHIDRIVTVMDELALAGNPVAQSIRMALLNKSEVQKRAIIAAAFSHVWNIVLVIHMAVNSDQKVGDIRRALREIRAGRSSQIEKVAEASAKGVAENSANAEQ